MSKQPAAIYARVSSDRQREQGTISSQTSALEEWATKLELKVPPEWIFKDDGVSGATLIRPELERLRDLTAEFGISPILCHSPDRLARKYAHQVLLLEEFGNCGTEVKFLKGGSADSPEGNMMIQFQGMVAEYERALIMERTRRGKRHSARQGSVSALGRAPYGFTYTPKGLGTEASFVISEPEASVVRSIFECYVGEYLSMGAIARRLTEAGTPTPSGKKTWTKSTIQFILNHPAYVGRAAYGRKKRTKEFGKLTRKPRMRGDRLPRQRASRWQP